MGFHPTRQVALHRALREAAQSRLTIIAGSRDDMSRASYAAWREPVNSARREVVVCRIQMDRLTGRRATRERV